MADARLEQVASTCAAAFILAERVNDALSFSLELVCFQEIFLVQKRTGSFIVCETSSGPTTLKFHVHNGAALTCLIVRSRFASAAQLVYFSSNRQFRLLNK